MNDEYLRCFWTYFARFVVHFHMVHRRAFACLSPYTHMFWGLGCYCKHLYDRCYIQYDSMCIRMG